MTIRIERVIIDTTFNSSIEQFIYLFLGISMTLWYFNDPMELPALIFTMLLILGNRFERARNHMPIFDNHYFVEE